jgi:hypothetical protein
MSIPSARGGGCHGHLAITITPAKYLALTEVVFDPPLNPGATPDHPAAATTAQITEANRHFDAARIEFQTFKIIEGLLKCQVPAAVHSMYIDKLNDETVGFATATCRGLLQHLRLHYGTITTPDQLEANRRQLDRQWQPPAPLEVLFQKIKKCQHFAEAGNDPITNKTAVHSALKNVEATGLFTDACRDWRKKAEAAQTLAAFKLDFSAADTERKRQTTSNTAGYYHHGANAVCAVVTAPPQLLLTTEQPALRAIFIIAGRMGSAEIPSTPAPSASTQKTATRRKPPSTT